jgi:putative ABC transport system permease protein
MNRFMRWRLALRLLLRDWRAGELRVLALAIIIAVAASTAIGFFTDRLGRGMVSQSADFLGADLVLSSPRPVSPAWLAQAREDQLRVSESLEFASVVVKGEALQLAGVRAVDERFPLRGELRTATAAFMPDGPATGIPAPGEAWAAPQLLTRLGLQAGDTVQVGESALVIKRALTFEPGQAANVFGVAPRLLINLADVPATGVVQPGSRLTYQYLFAGPEKVLMRFQDWLKPQLGASHQLVGVQEGRRAVGTALERAERFLGLAVIAAIVLAGVAIAMAARRYSERHFDMSAMLRCLGATQQDLLGLYLVQLLVLGLLASAAGCLFGWLAQQGLLVLLAGLLPMAPSAAGAWPILIGLATGVVVLAGFALPSVLRLRGVPPLRVLRRDLTPLPSNAWLVYGLAVAAVVLLMWRYTGNARLTVAVLAGGAAASAILALLGLLLLALGRRVHARVGVAWRFGLNNLWRRRRTSISQILAFGLALLAMAVIGLVRTDLLTTWESQLPDDVPNQFAINILPDQVEAVHAWLASQQVPASQLYPMVRGRLITINDEPVRMAVTKEARDDNALNRELNLTWTLQLQEDNSIINGRWWRTTDRGRPLVSVESKLAERLGIKLGDELGFTVSDQQFTAQVASIRSVQWDSFRPNFYMVFPPAVIEQFPATYMTSFYLTPQQKPLLVELVRNYPSITILEMDLIIAQVERIFRQVTLAVEYVLLFVLLAGFAVLFAALQASLDERLYEGALLRALGASRRQLRTGHLAEFAVLGALAGLVAAIGTECLAWVLYTQVLHFDYSFKWPVWLLAPLAGAVLIGAAGYHGTRSVVARSPVLLLRER